MPPSQMPKVGQRAAMLQADSEKLEVVLEPAPRSHQPRDADEQHFIALADREVVERGHAIAGLMQQTQQTARSRQHAPPFGSRRPFEEPRQWLSRMRRFGEQERLSRLRIILPDREQP